MEKGVIYQGKKMRVIEKVLCGIRVAIFQWLRLDEPSASIRSSHLTTSTVVKKKGIKDLVAEVQFAEGQLPKDIEEEFWPTQLEKYSALGIENIITVNPEPTDKKGALKRLISAKWISKTTEKNITVRNVYKADLENELKKIAFERMKKNKK